MELFDSKFRENRARYALQCLLATFCVLVVLLLLDGIANAAISAALGSSAFIVFAVPHARVSRPRYLIGGYVVGVAFGLLCANLAERGWFEQMGLPACPSRIVFGAAAVGVAIFVMAVTNTEHPPAASVALGLVLNDSAERTVVVVLLGILCLAALRTLLRRFLINLV